MIRSAVEFIELRFSEDPVDYNRAANEPAEIETWREVIENYPDARVWVAQNKTVPLEVLSVLAADQSRDVRFMVAMKRKLTAELLQLLGQDEDESIRLQVARHRNTPLEVLERLAEDDWHPVAIAAGGRLLEQ